MNEPIADERYVALAHAIVQQAVKDWRAMALKRKPSPCFNGLRQFFRSEYCQLLCGEADALAILARLEDERVPNSVKNRRNLT